jgi:hypothetical protein
MGIGGGAKFTDTKTDAEDANAAPDSAMATSRERRNRASLNAFVSCMGPPETR